MINSNLYSLLTAIRSSFNISCPLFHLKMSQVCFLSHYINQFLLGKTLLFRVIIISDAMKNYTSSLENVQFVCRQQSPLKLGIVHCACLKIIHSALFRGHLAPKSILKSIKQLWSLITDLPLPIFKVSSSSLCLGNHS